ncbi:hypothetical protein JCM6882_001881 [Rhodosporidiobolus microsporus]
MGKTATLHFVPLKNCLCNLPLSLHGPLAQRGVAPQSIAVQLSFKSPSAPSSAATVHLGWTGLPSSVAPVSLSSRGNPAPADRVEMDPQFAQMLNLGLKEGMTVNIELLRELPSATTVNVTPLSADDWEILETNAEFVEMFLLNQVRAVKEAMVIGCWVNGTTLVRFVVDSVSPSASPALLLTSSTELIVAPKPRHPAPSSSSQKPHDLSAPATSHPASSSSDWDKTRRPLLRLLPLDLEPEELTSAPANEKPGEDALFVAPGLAKAVRRSFPLARITLSHFPRPTSAAKSSSSGAPGAGAEQVSSPTAEEGPSPAPGATGAQEAAQVARPLVEVRVYESARVPPGHAWVGEKVRREVGLKVGEGEEAYELLRIGAPLSSQAKKARAKEQQQAGSVAGSTQTSPRINGSSSRPSLHQKLSTASHPRQPNGIHSSTSPTKPSAALPSSAPAPPPVLAGVDTQLSALKSHIVNSLAARKLASATGGRGESAPGVLVTGASGAGKTALVREVAREMERDERVLAHTIYIDCAKHADERLPTLKGRIKDWFDEACWHAPSLLVLDNLDRMLAAEVEHADSFPAQHLAQTFLSLAQPALSSRPVVLIATAQGSTNLHPLLTVTHVLGETVALRGPNKTGRRDILSALIAAKTASSPSSNDSPALTAAPSLNYASIAAMTEGYLPADLRDLVDRAVHQAAIRTMGTSVAAGEPLALTPSDFTAAQSGFVPLSLRDVKLQKSDVQWADIGGLHEARKTLRETLEWPTKYGAIFASCPLRLRSGLLLYGYPGCGKTLLASAVAKECGLNFISVKGPEILNKYIGASEKSVRDLFDRAQAAKPCILFFDEFDSIAPKRGHDSTGVTDRVVNQMLTQMDGAEGLDGVYVLAATSRPDLIDPALLRPGRLDKSILCDMPSESDRLEIMQSSARKIHLSPTVSLSHLAAATSGYSGADLQALIYNAHLDAIHANLAPAVGADGIVGGGGGGAGKENEEIRYVAIGGKEEEKVLSRAEQASVNKRLELILGAMKDAQKAKAKKKAAASSATPSSRAPTFVDQHHLDKSLETTRPSVPAEELARLRRIYNEFVSGRSANGLPSGEASDEVGGRASLM